MWAVPLPTICCPIQHSYTNHLLLQRRSRRSLALKQTSRGDLSPEAARSARRLSLDKAQSRQGSQKVLDSAQTLENNGIAADHQKPSGTTINPLADVETGQMANGNVGAAKTAPSNAGTYAVLWHSTWSDHHGQLYTWIQICGLPAKPAHLR